MTAKTQEMIEAIRQEELERGNFGEGSEYDRVFLQAARDAALRRGVERLRAFHRGCDPHLVTRHDKVAEELDALLRAGEETT